MISLNLDSGAMDQIFVHDGLESVITATGVTKGFC